MSYTPKPDFRGLANKFIINLMTVNPKYLVMGRSEEYLDCYGFIVLFYSKVFGVDIPDIVNIPPHKLKIFNWIEAQRKLWNNHPSGVNLDLVTFNKNGMLYHLGILIDNKIFHMSRKGLIGTPHNKLSLFGLTGVEYHQYKEVENESCITTQYL